MLDAQRLKFLRISHNVTQDKCAEWCGVSKRYIIMVENGECNPSEEVYNAYLNCVYGIGKPIPKSESNIKRSETAKAKAVAKKPTKTTKTKSKTQGE